MLETVQELCRSFYGVTAVTAESYGCVWHCQHRHVGDNELELPLGDLLEEADRGLQIEFIEMS